MPTFKVYKDGEQANEVVGADKAALAVSTHSRRQLV